VVFYSNGVFDRKEASLERLVNEMKKVSKPSIEKIATNAKDHLLVISERVKSILKREENSLQTLIKAQQRKIQEQQTAIWVNLLSFSEPKSILMESLDSAVHQLQRCSKTSALVSQLTVKFYLYDQYFSDDCEAKLHTLTKYNHSYISSVYGMYVYATSPRKQELSNCPVLRRDNNVLKDKVLEYFNQLLANDKLGQQQQQQQPAVSFKDVTSVAPLNPHLLKRAVVVQMISMVVLQTTDGGCDQTTA